MFSIGLTPKNPISGQSVIEAFNETMKELSGQQNWSYFVNEKNRYDGQELKKVVLEASAKAILTENTLKRTWLFGTSKKLDWAIELFLNTLNISGKFETIPIGVIITYLDNGVYFEAESPAAITHTRAMNAFMLFRDRFEHHLNKACSCED